MFALRSPPLTSYSKEMEHAAQEKAFLDGYTKI